MLSSAQVGKGGLGGWGGLGSLGGLGGLGGNGGLGHISVGVNFLCTPGWVGLTAPISPWDPAHHGFRTRFLWEQ